MRDDDPVKALIAAQRHFFATGKTLSVAFRIEQLQKLKTKIKLFEPDIIQALKLDLNKSVYEAVTQEIELVLKELDLFIKKLKKWSQPLNVSTPFPLWPGRSQIQFDPYGCVLILGPWNFPFLLIMSPLIGAIGAGNCVIVKSSETAQHTQQLIMRLIKACFPSNYVAAITASPDQMQTVLAHQYDYIFFTGGTEIGKIIMQAAANHLTPVTLELGGKSPCIVDESAAIHFAARRIVRSKFSNAGQVCIAPDYIVVHESQKRVLISALSQAIREFYGDDPQKSASYGRIINRNHFDRLSHLLQKGNIVLGGKTDSRDLYIAPSLIDGITWDDPIMQAEIFGPLLPIISYERIDDLIEMLKQKPKPLALYYFTESNQKKQNLLAQLSFGGGCINDCMLHVANMNLPFGGVGESGMGCYHGRYSFATFSHHKSIYTKSFQLDFKLEYPPYTESKLRWIRWLFKMWRL